MNRFRRQRSKTFEKSKQINKKKFMFRIWDFIGICRDFKSFRIFCFETAPSPSMFEIIFFHVSGIKDKTAKYII
jgi:hypothetical protein